MLRISFLKGQNPMASPTKQQKRAKRAKVKAKQ